VIRPYKPLISLTSCSVKTNLFDIIINIPS
jgi:hypothetical protein